MFEGILGNLQGMLGGINLPGVQKAAPENVFYKTLSTTNLWDTALESASGKISAKNGYFTTIGRFKVPAQQSYHWGFGTPAYPDNQGYLYMVVKDDQGTPAAIPGVVRLVQRNNAGTLNLTVAEFRTEQLSGDAADRKKQMALPEQAQFPLVGEDSYLEIAFQPDSATAVNVTKANCIWNTPVSCYQ